VTFFLLPEFAYFPQGCGVGEHQVAVAASVNGAFSLFTAKHKDGLNRRGSFDAGLLEL
jgi:hypothetical protein